MSCQTNPTTVEEAIDQAAKNPLSVSIAGHTVTNQPIDSLVSAYKFQKANDGAAKKGFGIRLQKICLPGAWE